MKEFMNKLNLTDAEYKIENPFFENLSRVDNFYFASKVDRIEQIDFLKKQNINLVVDLKLKEETDFNDEQEFKDAKISYIHFPISDIDNISFKEMNKLKDQIESVKGNKLIYCMSANRVGALMTLFLSELLGNPKARAFELGCKVGMNKVGLQEKVKHKIGL